jgi:hypothetical protein
MADSPHSEFGFCWLRHLRFARSPFVSYRSEQPHIGAPFHMRDVVLGTSPSFPKVHDEAHVRCCWRTLGDNNKVGEQQMKKTAFFVFDLRHSSLSGGSEAGSSQSPLSTRHRRQPGVSGVPLASGAARAASLSRAPGGAAESSLAAFHQCRIAFEHHLRHGPQLRRAGRARTGARHGGGRRHDGVRRAPRAAVPDARGVSSPVIARSDSDEAIQILAQAALDCFAFARNDDMPFLGRPA